MNIEGICKALEGKIRGNAVAVSLFEKDIPPQYQGFKVDPCQILRHAMDDGALAYFDREYQDCLHGAFITGVHEGNEQIRSGRILTDYIPVYNEDSAYALNSGKSVLPQGTVRAIGTAPLDKVPEGVNIDWIAVVCTPAWACQIAAARAVEDGVQPASAAGGSFCTDLFVSPWFEENVVLTPGDMGGRMNNKLKPEELFVIIPTRWADNLVKLFGEMPDVKGIYEATRPEDSEYWERQRAKEAKAAARSDDAANKLAKEKGLKISMNWECEAIELVARSPRFVRGFAVGNIEDFAESKGYTLITRAVIEEQMESSGAGKYLKFLN
ncbi:DUF169 domain-containing protein [Spongiibacter sp.]|uniref:DUF169 domain-containing protein n=1 Tax=Spongiibacter sp. TaxID=2024860 RepID=UPI00356A90B0